MRVHELAKILDISTKDICNFLSNEEKSYKTMSGLTQDEENKVRDKFGNQSKQKESREAHSDIKNAEKSNSAEKNNTADKNNNAGKNNNTPVKKEEGKEAKVSNEKPDKLGSNDDSNEKKHKTSQLFFPENSGRKGSDDKNKSKKFNQGTGQKDVKKTQHPAKNKEEERKTFSSDKRNNDMKNRNSEKDNNNGQPGRKVNSGERHEKDGHKFNHNDKKSFDNKNGSSDQDPRKNNPKKNNNQKKQDFAGKDEKESFAFATGKHDKHGKHKGKDKDKDKSKDDFKAEQFIEKPKKKEEVIKEIVIPEFLTIKDLAEKIKKTPAQLIKDLFMKGQVVTVNTEIEYEQAEEICLDYDVLCEKEKKVDVIAELLKEGEENVKDMTERPPVVAVMGHVDHGKTSLLDAIRETNVTDKESGGITQKIGAYQVKTQSGKMITFLDTPGHEAFTSMRMRGAQSTDIAILVVAADDGVMPQTVEAINHAKAAGVEIIVAVNKIDKPTANVDKVKQELMEYELIPEEWGGSTVFCPVSAHTGEGIDDLLEMILLTADVLELKANKKRKARGIVIEAEIDTGRGVVATVLVQKGTLRVGDSVAAGASFGKIRAMINDKNKRIKEAGPSTPVEILGLNDVPNAGEILMAFSNDKEARNFSSTFVSEGKKKLVDASRHKMSLDALFDQIKSGNLKELKLIVKADVQGSVEAIKQSLEKLSNDEVVVKIIHGGVGHINESDVILASASNAIIIGFNVKLDNKAKDVTEDEVDIRLYNVIYDAIEDVESALKGMLEPIYEERVIGHAEIRQIFKASGIGNIGGAVVMDGKITSKALIKITREGKEIYKGKMASLKRFKDEVKEVKGGYECGLVFDGFDLIAEGDIVEASEMFEIPR